MDIAIHCNIIIGFWTFLAFKAFKEVAAREQYAKKRESSCESVSAFCAEI